MAVGPTAYRCLVLCLQLITRVFFSRIEVTGLEHVPRDGGGIVVAWHPNGLIDALLILCCCPRQVVFGARHGLFEVPVLGWLIRALGTVRLYRPQDEGTHSSEAERRTANRRSLASLATAARQSFVAIFPEGATHDEPQLLELRCGAARLFYMAMDPVDNDVPTPVILPVGLHYDKKHAFRSRVLVAFHPPLELPSELTTRIAVSEEVERARIDRLTGLIDSTLREVVHATESWQLNHTVHRGRKLVRAERAARAGTTLSRSGMEERELGFARMWVGYNARLLTHPVETERVMARIRRYDEAMRLLHLEDRDLDRKSHRYLMRRIALLLAEAAAVFILLPPLVLLGYIVNLPTALLLKYVSTKLSKTRKEQAGLKVMLGALAFPLTWVAASLAVAWSRPSFWASYAWTPQTPALAATLAFLLCAVSGAVALRYHRVAAELSRSLRTLLTRSRRFAAIGRMREHRSHLYDSLMEEGLQLPGEVQPDGRVAARGPSADAPDRTPSGR